MNCAALRMLTRLRAAETHPPLTDEALHSRDQTTGVGHCCGGVTDGEAEMCNRECDFACVAPNIRFCC